MKDYNYVITTGWWCDNDSSEGRDIKYGSTKLRKKDFFYLWYECVKKYSSPAYITVVDSASPVKPELNEFNDVYWITLKTNPGHSTRHTGKFSGVTYAHVIGMTMALLDNFDYWVYIEQDALIKGEGIIEYAISKMKKQIMFGSGKGTPQPMQQSFMIFRREAIANFIKKLTAIDAKDIIVSPEEKFAIAANPILSRIIPLLFKECGTPCLYSGILKKALFMLANTPFNGFQKLPFGYGRVRPIDFMSDYFYFQHGTDDELENFISLQEK